MPIQGFVRMRRHQFGRQAAIGEKVLASRLYPFSGVPAVDLQWTDPAVDVGSIDPVAPQLRGPGTATANLTDPAVTYNNLPLMFAGILGGAVTPTGAGATKTWLWEPASDASDEIDPATYEFGDDVVSDWYQLADGVESSLELSGPEGLGPVTAAMNWTFGSASSTGSTDSPADAGVPSDLSLDLTDPKVYLKDAGLYIASSTAGLAAGQVTDALHSMTLRITQAWDLKRFANATQTYDVSAYGRGDRAIEFEATFAKTADTVGTGSESDAWYSDDPVTRYVRMAFTSTIMTTGIVPFSWEFTLPLRYYTRTEGAVGGNTVIVLTGHAFLEDVSYHKVFSTTVVNTLATADLDGTPAS